MMNEELTKLIEKAMKGDLEAFEQVVRSKAAQITYISMKLLRNRHDGEDAAQEALLKMYQHIGELKSPQAFNSWAYQITTRTCIDFKRKQARDDHDHLELKDEVNEMKRDFLPQEFIEDAEKREFLMNIIDDLPDYHRTCLLLFYFENMSYREIAASLDVPYKLVANSLVRSKQKIRQRLEAEYGDKFQLLAMPAVAAMPVLTQLFQWEAQSMATPEVLERIVVGTTTAAGTMAAAAAQTGAGGAVTAKVISGAGGTAGSAGASSSAGMASSAGATGSAGATSATGAAGSTMALGLPVKVAIGIVAAATAAGGVVVYTTGSESVRPPAGSSVRQEETAILTLEDMIGETAATELRGYVDGDGEPDRWEEFLQSLPARNISGIVAGEAAYTLYHLEKQDKQLLILEKRERDQLETVYRFTDSHEEPPEKGDLMRSMAGWQQ